MRVGSLCTGYSGLDMAVAAVTGAHTVWVADNDPAATRLLAHRYPHLPNLGDLTRVDWGRVEPVEVLAAGFPCQPVSHAGKRLGADDERWLWDDIVAAVRLLRPRLLVLENVRGLLTAGVGRLMGRVVGSLAGLGYDTEWVGLRAADVGAPHGRFRVFILAWPATNTIRRGLAGWAPDPLRRPLHGAAAAGGGEDARLLPTPTSGDAGNITRDHKGRNQRDDATCLTGALLPTPAVNDMGEGKTPEAWDAWTARMKTDHGNGNGHGPSLAIEAMRLLPTPTVEDRKASGGGYHGQTNVTLTDATVRQPQDWGQYADAIHRWETLTRPAPPPTETGPRGAPRLNPRFSEWMMGLPDGWITDTPHITRNQALKLAGNGVVPQQATAALTHLLHQADR